MASSILLKFTSGKPIKLFYFIQKVLLQLLPDAYYQRRLVQVIRRAGLRDDYDYILQRVNYYCKCFSPWTIGPVDEAYRGRSFFSYRGEIAGYKRKMFSSAYYYDQHDVTKWFDQHFRWDFCPGDVYFTPQTPTVVKSRLLLEDNSCSVLLKLDKLRHFMFLNDPIPFTGKKDVAIFRGKIRLSRIRTAFMERFIHHPLVDCGVVDPREEVPLEWIKPKMSILQHLDYKFILALEGNDVASNLKWVMSSNSLAVMTRPTCETWFMEGTLQPGVHYVEVKDDFSDLDEKLNHYINHPLEAQQIIDNAHHYVSQFMDAEREQLIQLMVMNRYFYLSGQMPSYF